MWFNPLLAKEPYHPLRDEDMGVPGIKPNAVQIEEWLDKDEGNGMSLEEATVYVRKKAQELKTKK